MLRSLQSVILSPITTGNGECWTSPEKTARSGSSAKKTSVWAIFRPSYQDQKSRKLLPMLEGMEKENFPNLVTGDKSWSTLHFQHSAKWDVSRDDVI
jgi:hypothetical protein